MAEISIFRGGTDRTGTAWVPRVVSGPEQEPRRANPRPAPRAAARIIDSPAIERGENVFRLRYRVNGRRFAKTFRGTLSDARKELRRLIRSGDIGEHIAPDRTTLGEWIDRWVALLERQQDEGEQRRRGLVSARTIERYAELLRCHVKPALGGRFLQQIQPSDIDDLYMRLEKKRAPRTVHHVHTVLGACFKSAMRKGLVATSPVARAEAPSPGEADHGMVLDEDQLRTLFAGFKGSALFPIVAVAAFTGARRNEILALRWSDLDAANKTLRIARALEKTDKHGLALKEPKTARGKRTIAIDDNLFAILCGEREQLLRLKAGVPDGMLVDLSLVKLPDDALMFPNPPGPGESFSLTKLRVPANVTKEFGRRASKLGFPDLRFHDLRGTHETLLLDAGVPVHVVAARCGHDPAVLLRSYAKRTRKAGTRAADVIGALSHSALG
jgi:integrase